MQHAVADPALSYSYMSLTPVRVGNQHWWVYWPQLDALISEVYQTFTIVDKYQAWGEKNRSIATRDRATFSPPSRTELTAMYFLDIMQLILTVTRLRSVQLMKGNNISYREY